MRHGLALVGDLQRFDRQADAPPVAIDAGDVGVHLVAHGVAVGALLGALAREVGLANEALHAVVEGHLDAAADHGRDDAGDGGAALVVLDPLHGIVAELLDTQADAFLFDVDAEHLGLDQIALLVIRDGVVARAHPVEIGEVHHAVDVALQPDEDTELGDALDLALDLGTRRKAVVELDPGVLLALLEAQADAALVGIDVEHHDLDLLAGGDNLAGVHVLLGPAHLGDVDQALDAGLELDEGAVIGDVGDAAAELGVDRVLDLDALPGIGFELLHAQADALGLEIEADHLDAHGLADVDRLGGVVDAAPGHVGDVQQAVDAAEIDEGAVIGDVLDHALEHLAFLEVGDQFLARLGPGLLQHGAPRDHDVAPVAVHLEDLEGLRRAHQGRDVAHRPDVDLAARQKGHGAGKIDGKAALDAAEDDAADALVLLEGDLELGPGLLAPRFFTTEHGLALQVLHALEIDLDGVAKLDLGGLAGNRELLQCHPSLGLEAHVDHRHVVLDGNHGARNDPAHQIISGAVGLVQEGGEILFDSRHFLAAGGDGVGHVVSWSGLVDLHQPG